MLEEQTPNIGKTPAELNELLVLLRQQSFSQRLGLSPSATAKDITSAFRRLSTEFHPDKYSQDPERGNLCNQVQQLLGEAYTALKGNVNFGAREDLDSVIKIDRSFKPNYTAQLLEMRYKGEQNTGPIEYKRSDIKLFFHEKQTSGIKVTGGEILTYLEQNGMIPRCLNVQDGLALAKELGISIFRKAKYFPLWKSIAIRKGLYYKDDFSTSLDVPCLVQVDNNGVPGVGIKWFSVKLDFDKEFATAWINK